MNAAAPLKPFPRENLRLWAVDPLEKVFQDTLPPADAAMEVVLEAARGEVVSGQVALRITGMTHAAYTTSGCGIDQVTVEPLRRQGDDDEIGRGSIRGNN